MTASQPKPIRLSDREKDLLARICLKRFEVRHLGYMGSYRPNESVTVSEIDPATCMWVREPVYERMRFRPATYESLRAKGLVRKVDKQTDASGEIKPTRAGMDVFQEQRLITRLRRRDEIVPSLTDA